MMPIKHKKIKFRHGKGGFTLIEMLVTVSIFILITSVVLANYPKYGSRLALGRIAREMALLIRQAQVYGIAVKEVSTISARSTRAAFGISLDTSKPHEFIFFSDKGTSEVGTKDNHVFDVGDGCNTNGDTECEEIFRLEGKEYIKSVTFTGVETNTYPTGEGEARHITILFQRPDPDASFYLEGNPLNDVESCIIELTSERFPDRVKRVRIWITGQIAVMD